MFLMMMLTVVDVSGRYFFNSPLTGTTEITIMLMVIVIFPALGWAATNRMHVRVVILSERLPRKVQRVLTITGFILSLCIFGIITWRCFLEASQVSKQTSLIHIPFSPFYWIMAVGMAIFTLAIIVILIEEITGVEHK